MSDAATPVCEFDPKRLVVRLDLTVDGDVKGIDSVVEGVMTVVRSMSCAAGKEFEVETALREALANAIVHGCREDPGKRVRVCVGCDEERGLLIIVRDPGEGFEPEAIPSPIAGTNVFSEHGRGIYLIQQMMDDVRFERGGTEIRMLKR